MREKGDVCCFVGLLFVCALLLCAETRGRAFTADASALSPCPMYTGIEYFSPLFSSQPSGKEVDCVAECGSCCLPFMPDDTCCWDRSLAS